MNIWSSLISTLKGDSKEANESILDKKALSILDDEVRQTADGLVLSKKALSELIAKQRRAENNILQCQNNINEHENYALKALEKNDESLALEVAEKIVELEADKQQQITIQEGYASTAKDLKHMVKQAEFSLKRLKQQIDTIKATESVQRAQAAVTGRHNNSKQRMQTAQESLARLKERQVNKATRFEVEKELSAETRRDSLLEKLEQAGISTGSTKADDVLSRLKNK